MAKKRNPQDATLRNTRARATEIAEMKSAIAFIRKALKALDDRITTLEGGADGKTKS